MKKRISIAAIVAIMSVLVYPYTSALAAVERGYDGYIFDGEEMLLLFGLFVAALIIVDGLQKQREAIEKDDHQPAVAFPSESEGNDEQVAIPHANYTTNSR